MWPYINAFFTSKNSCFVSHLKIEIEILIYQLEQKYLIIHDLCQLGMDIIHNMRVINTDALTYQRRLTEKYIQTVEKDKNQKYLDAFLQCWHRVSLFVVLVDSLLGVNFKATMKRLSSRLAVRWKKTYSSTCGYFKSRIDVALVCENHLYIQGFRFLSIRISA